MMIGPIKIGWNVAALLPLALFLFFYSNSLLMIFSGMGIFLFLGYQFSRYFSGEAVKSVPILFVLLFSFAAYGIHNLGSSNAPQTFAKLIGGEYYGPQEQGAVFSFSPDTKINKACFYTGILSSIGVEGISMDGDTQNTLFTNKDDYPQSFHWMCSEFPAAPVNRVWLKVTSIEGEQEIGEIAFFLGRKRVFPDSGPNALLDESHIKVDIGSYGGMYFDEIYHGRTAFEHINTDRVLYETTHPMFGKELISIGVRVFGMTPFGWRIVPFLFGILFILVMYHFSKQITNKKFFGLVGAFLATYSFIHLTQSRVALVDIFGTFFILLTYLLLYVFIKKQELKYLLASGVFFGLASGIKWSAVFGAGGLLLIAVYLILSRYPMKKIYSGWRLILWGVMAYGLLSVLVYVLTFYPLAFRGDFSLAGIYDYNVNMLDYHVAEATSHPYSSAWWTWILNLHPMCIYRGSINDMYSSINFVGHPLIFIPGIVAMLYVLFLFIKERRLEQVFILSGYLSLLLPYAFVSRIMFIYHYSYSLYFLMLALVYSFYRLSQKNKVWYPVVFTYLILVGVVFIYYYSVLTGYPLLRTHLPESMNIISTWAL